MLALEREIGAAIVRGDTAYFERATAADFVMTHGDGWTRGEPPALVDDQSELRAPRREQVVCRPRL